MQHFEDEHVRVFKERWNDLLLKLRYEERTDWSVAATTRV